MTRHDDVFDLMNEVQSDLEENSLNEYYDEVDWLKENEIDEKMREMFDCDNCIVEEYSYDDIQAIIELNYRTNNFTKQEYNNYLSKRYYPCGLKFFNVWTEEWECCTENIWDTPWRNCCSCMYEYNLY